MYYLIDGYNLIFSLMDSKASLQKQREGIIRSLQVAFSKKKAQGLIAFDGAHRRDEESGLSYASPLVVAYAPRGESADSYIVEKIEASQTPKQMTVVSNDRGLIRQAKALGAKALSNHEFIDWLHKSKKRKREIEPKESPANFDRLLKIFEERLKAEMDKQE